MDPEPLFAFGHGLSYTRFEYADLVIRPEPALGRTEPGSRAIVATDGTVEIACTVRNAGTRPGDEIVQLYLRDPAAQVVRPERWLAGFTRVSLAQGEARRVAFRLHSDRTAFHGKNGHRIVEPGEIQVMVGGASDALPLRGSFWLHGLERAAGADRALDTPAVISCCAP